MACPPPVTTATRPFKLNLSRYMMPVPLRSTHPVAAVDVEGLGDNVVAFGRGEEDRGADMVLRLAHAAERHRFTDQPLLLADPAPFVLGEQGVDLVPHRRVDHARRDAVDVDAVLDEA